jgi:hypothetical protein
MRSDRTFVTDGKRQAALPHRFQEESKCIVPSTPQSITLGTPVILVSSLNEDGSPQSRFRDSLCQDIVGTQLRLYQPGANWPLFELRGLWISLCPSSLLVSMTSIFAGGPDILRAAYAIEFVCQVQHRVVWG